LGGITPQNGRTIKTQSEEEMDNRNEAPEEKIRGLSGKVVKGGKPSTYKKRADKGQFRRTRNKHIRERKERTMST